MSQFTAEQEEILRKWGQVAKQHEKAIHFDFSKEYYNEGIVELKVRLERFLNTPNKEAFTKFWEKLWAAWRTASATSILNRWDQEGKTIRELKELIEEIYKSDEYNNDWERILGAKNSLRELYGKLNIEECPIQNSCANNSLKWFGYKPKQSYIDFQKVFEEFKNEYQQIVGYVTNDTDHKVPINFEIDQLFNIINKVLWSDLGKESNNEIRDFYRLILNQKPVDLRNMNVQDLIVYYLINEKEDHVAHEDEIIRYVQDTQSKLVKKGRRTERGLAAWLTQLKNKGIISNDGLEDGYYRFSDQKDDYSSIVDVTKPRRYGEIAQNLKIEKLGQKFDITNLHFEQKTNDAMVRQITSALKNGKHIILIGPPGTGKSKLGKEICDSYCGRGEYTMTTATSDWSTFDTIGGYVQDESGKLKFSPGVFLKCFQDANGDQINKWLIIDEINRADIDKAFGEMFSALTGDDISLPLTRNDKAIEIIGSRDSNSVVESHRYFIPEDWRIIATMNTFDKTSLYEMSYAFMRRFAFIPVDIPKEINAGLINNYLEKWDIKGNEKITDRLSKIWATINKYRKIGPAIIEDVYRYVEATENDFTPALIMYVLPQFEGLDEDKLVEFVKEILKEINDENDRLISFVSDYFEIHEDKLIE